jgi:hypothetical protein
LGLFICSKIISPGTDPGGAQRVSRADDGRQLYATPDAEIPAFLAAHVITGNFHGEA